jgi:hypothetical protein
VVDASKKEKPHLLRWGVSPPTVTISLISSLPRWPMGFSSRPHKTDNRWKNLCILGRSNACYHGICKLHCSSSTVVCGKAIALQACFADCADVSDRQRIRYYPALSCVNFDCCGNRIESIISNMAISRLRPTSLIPVSSSFNRGTPISSISADLTGMRWSGKREHSCTHWKVIR